MSNNILFIGGNWDLYGGKKSKIVELFAEELPNATVYNGGNYYNLCRIIPLCTNYEIVLWWANVPNDLPKIRHVKEVNYKALLVSSKRNNGEYTFEDLLQRSLGAKANLTIEFTKTGKKYSMRLFDPLGNVWYEGTNIRKCAKKMMARLEFLQSITRESTSQSEEKIEDLDWIFQNYDKDFLNLVKSYANVFTEATFQTKDVKRFLGNASFRCPKGFPSFRYGDFIFVSKRNVNKEFISIDDFVPVFWKNGRLYYCGENKPSVDTPIQIRLYKALPNIDFMIHSHCYIKDAPFTKKRVPCGALEEVPEILDAIKEHYNGDTTKEFYVINLIGHGSIMMSKDPKKLENIQIVGRPLPEKTY